MRNIIYSMLGENKMRKGTCRGSLYECPYVQKYQDKLIKTNYDCPHKATDCDKCWRKLKKAQSAKPDASTSESDKSKVSNKSKISEAERDVTEKSVSSSAVTLVRSTRAQDLRSQCNRDLLKPKSVCEKTRVVSPYVTLQQQQKKKRSSITPATNRSVPSPKQTTEDKKNSAKNGREKCATAQSSRKQKREKTKEATAELQREKTRDVIHPKVVAKKEMDDSGDRPGLRKSQTFFICKGPKRGEGDDVGKVKTLSSGSTTGDSASDIEESPTPDPNPLTHNDSFCLIAKSSQNWSQKKRGDDENRFHPQMVHLERPIKDEKGILKSSNRDLKFVDSVEKIECEKIVRFSDELTRKRKVLRKYVRRKNKLQNTIAVAWYRKNKIFQKYLQVLKAKSVLHANPDDVPENLKPFQVPVFVRERYEAEMLGIVPRKSKSAKGKVKKNNY